MRELLPDGYDFHDVPWAYFEAVRMAMVFLSWEELEKKERPPKRIWQDGPAIKAWFAQVNLNREREAKGQARVHLEDGGPMTRNAAVDDLLVGS